MFFPKIKPRGFQYTPQYYDESKELKETGRRPIRFKKHSSGGKSGIITLLKLLIFAIIVVYFIIKLKNI